MTWGQHGVTEGVNHEPCTWQGISMELHKDTMHPALAWGQLGDTQGIMRVTMKHFNPAPCHGGALAGTDRHGKHWGCNKFAT